MIDLRDRVATRLMKELQEAGWEEVSDKDGRLKHRDYGVHELFDAAYIQRDAEELVNRGWVIKVRGYLTYFQHPTLGFARAHEALLIQKAADADAKRIKMIKWLCILLYASLLGHCLYLFMGG